MAVPSSGKHHGDTVTYAIEPATPADADGAAALHYLSHTTSFAAFATPEFVASRRLDNYLAQWRDFLGKQGPGAGAWVARLDGRIVGIVRVAPMPEDGPAQLSSMHVHPDLHGRGIGQALMTVAEDFIRKTGYRRAILGVILANERARRLYERSGWSSIETHPTGVEGVPYAVYGKRFA